MADFKAAFIAIIAGHEGGYVNDPNDRGGETYKGIARKKNPTWGGWAIISAYKLKPGFPGNMSTDNELNLLILAFYKQNYWDVIHLDEIKHQEIATEMFDVAVNMGPKQAVLIVQGSLNLLNRNQQDYKDLVVDGAIGYGTISTINAFAKPSVLLKTMNGLQFSRYVKICTEDATQEKYFQGWLNRV